MLREPLRLRLTERAVHATQRDALARFAGTHGTPRARLPAGPGGITAPARPAAARLAGFCLLTGARGHLRRPSLGDVFSLFLAHRPPTPHPLFFGRTQLLGGFFWLCPLCLLVAPGSSSPLQRATFADALFICATHRYSHSQAQARVSFRGCRTPRCLCYFNQLSPGVTSAFMLSSRLPTRALPGRVCLSLLLRIGAGHLPLAFCSPLSAPRYSSSPFARWVRRLSRPFSSPSWLPLLACAHQRNF